MLEEVNWDEYYQKIQGRPVRQLLLDALEKFPSPSSLQAIDLGFGDGSETVELLKRGWNVLAIDSEPASVKRLNEKLPAQVKSALQTQVAKFEEVKLSPADLIHASYSIPFCHPNHFPALWSKITNALNLGGRFAGQFFGVHDTWAGSKGMTFHTDSQVRAMLDGLTIEYFHEQDEDGQAASGPKHWHVFTVIAKKI